MKIKFFLLLIAVSCAYSLLAQNTYTAFIQDGKTREPLTGATVLLSGTSLGAMADDSGRVTLAEIPDGTQTLIFRMIGFKEQRQVVVFPRQDSTVSEILLEEDSEELEEVMVSSTRSTRTIENVPTRIEFIGSEELDEKGNMKPGDIRMLLNESTGIHVQTTSATSGNAGIRIQGLDGRYTQILKDGFPVYSGAAAGLGLLQIPPLDLKQVEVIKGSTSTLYGGGAIAGLVNLVSKTPADERDLRFHVNATSGRGLDVNGFYGQRFEKWGATVFASHNRNEAYDPSDAGFSAIPRFKRFVFNPKLYLYFNSKASLSAGVNATVEDRKGGDMLYLKGRGDDTHRYFEENRTRRYSTQFTFDYAIDAGSAFQVKNSLSYFNRSTAVPGYRFEGTQRSSFTEASYTRRFEKTEWIAGLNGWTDDFKEKRLSDFPLRSYRQITFGVFLQNDWDVSERVQLETGLRSDYTDGYGMVVLPRVSALFRIAKGWTSRIGGGFGYKTPSLFTEESEQIQYRNVRPIDKASAKLEKSYGGNADVNYRTALGEDATFSINQLFFYTRLDHPLLLQSLPDGKEYELRPSAGAIHTKGTETNVKIVYHDVHLFLGYTFTDTRLHENGAKAERALIPKHRLNSVLMYEVEDAWKLGLEAFYYSRQKLSDGVRGKDYVLCGFMAEKMWRNFAIYINFENMFDARQTRFDTIYTGTVSNPVFRDIYAPLDGFLINGGIKINL